MALSPSEQNKVMLLLGYGAKTIQAGSVIYNKILNDRLNNLPTPSEDLVRSWLGKIATLETQIDDAPARLAAKKLDGLEMNLQEIEMLRRERKRISREIANHLDIPYQGLGGVNIGVTA